ncbi:MAG: hypothetical protein Q8R65_07765 [Polynucleobacter sp.]|nr:hypothetical protein [Polynucleobacter sp.]
MHITFKSLLISSALALSSASALAQDSKETHAWSCSNNHQLKTVGNGEGNIGLVWNSKTYEMKKETSLPGSLRFKNHDTGLDLVVLGNKAMLFNIRSGIRLADFCQTADMKTGKEPHLFAKE